MDEPNPYQSPVEKAEYVADGDPTSPFNDAFELTVASSGRRFINWIVDSIGAGATIVVFVGILNVLQIEPPQEGSPLDIWFAVIFWAVFASYYVVTEGIWSRTPAKWLTGTFVVDKQGEKPGIGRVFWRTVARFVPLEPFTFLVGGRWPVGFHDSASGTRVVHPRLKKRPQDGPDEDTSIA